CRCDETNLRDPPLMFVFAVPINRVNPTFERQFEWIESEVFEIVGTHLGYNVDAIRKQMVTACKMTFN
ncbi:hypothetical protein VBM08_15710, partial [Enterobacter hormaechei]|nr:hypothetical protein [Enterobacter hormaechei]